MFMDVAFFEVGMNADLRTEGVMQRQKMVTVWKTVACHREKT